MYYKLKAKIYGKLLLIITVFLSTVVYCEWLEGRTGGIRKASKLAGWYVKPNKSKKD